MSDQRINDIRSRVMQSTPGAWLPYRLRQIGSGVEYWVDTGGSGEWFYRGDASAEQILRDGTLIAHCRDDLEYMIVMYESMDRQCRQYELAHSTLSSELRKAVNELAAANAEIAKLRGDLFTATRAKVERNDVDG
jgi:hypothetical protein